ncbi:MAG: heparinase II/III family protein, partial [Pseudomonadota bacterium]
RQGAFLRLANKRCWTFRVRGAVLSLEDSVFIDQDGVMRPTRQIVLGGETGPEGVDVQWSLKVMG